MKKMVSKMKTKTRLFSKSLLSLILAMIILVSCMIVGITTFIAATETTVYYAIPSNTVGSYSVKCNVNRQGDGDNWAQYDMSTTGYYYDGDPIYSCTFTDLYNGLGALQFQLYNGNTYVSQEQPINEWTTVDTYNGKMWVYGGSDWIDYTYDTSYTYYIEGRFKGLSDWQTTSTSLQLTETSTSGLYKYETGYTLAQLSADNNGTPYFFFGKLTNNGSTIKNWYRPSSDTALTESNRSTNYSVTESSSTGTSFYFNDTSSTNSNPVTLYLDTNNNYFYFEVVTYTLSVGYVTGSSSSMGTVSVSSGKATASPATGYQFDGWFSDEAGTVSVSTATSYTPTLTDDTTLYAKFSALDTFKVTYGVNDADYGSVTAEGSTTGSISSGDSVYQGENVTFTASAESGYEIEGWYSDSSCTTAISGAGTNSTYTASNVNAALTVYVKFEASSWPPSFVNDYSDVSSDSTAQIDVSNSNDVSGKNGATASYYYYGASGYELKTYTDSSSNVYYWISLSDADVTTVKSNEWMYYAFTSNKSNGTGGYQNLTTSATVEVDSTYNCAVSSSGVQDYNYTTDNVSTTYNFAKVQTDSTERSYIEHVGIKFDVTNNKYTVYYYGSSASTTGVYFKGLGGTWTSGSTTWPEGTQVDDTAEYTYTVTSDDYVTGDDGDGFYFRVVYNGTEYGPSGSSNELISTTATTTTNTSSDKAFYFEKSKVGATIHALLSDGTLSVWYTEAHTYYETPEYYVVGRFKVYDSSSSSWKYTKNGYAGSWSSTLTDSSEYFKFTEGTSTTSGTTKTTEYTLDTGATIKELSTEIDSKGLYFLVYDQNYWFGDTTNSGKGNSFINYNSESNALTLSKYSNTSDLATSNEMLFNDTEDENGPVTLHLKVSGTTGEGGTIDKGTATYSLWYTVDYEYVTDSASLSVSPASVQSGGSVTLTATYSNYHGSDTNNIRYTFYRYNGSSWTALGEAQASNTLAFTESNVGTNTYKVVISTTETYDSSTAYATRYATATGTCFTAGIYMSDHISDTNSVTWSEDLTSYSTSDYPYVKETSSTYTNSNPYIFALSYIDDFYLPTPTTFTIDTDNMQNCTIKTSYVDTSVGTIRTYVVTPNTCCTTPVIYLDVKNSKVYATATYTGATEGKTLDSSETVTYYFAEAVHSNSVNLSDSADSTNQTTAGTGKGMRIRYWNASVQTGSSATDAMGETDVYTPVTVNSSSSIYVKMEELYTDIGSTLTGVQQFYVYKVDLPVGATSFKFLTDESAVIDSEYLWSQDIHGGAASDVLNPDRIYLLFNALADGTSGAYYRCQGVVLDEGLWSSSNTTNQVDTKNFDSNLINYTDISSARTSLNTDTVNTSLSTAYEALGTPHSLYFGDFNGYTSSLNGFSLIKNLAQRANNKSYYASVQDFVGMTLSTSSINTNGYGYLLDTQSNDAYGISEAENMPLFDYTNLAANSGNYAGIASAVYQGLNFPMNKGTFNGITTYSYDSTTDYNRIYSDSDFKVQTSDDTVASEDGNSGYECYAYGRDADGNSSRYIGFFPFGGNNDQYSNTGFGVEFDVSFYMTNTGALQGTDGTSQDIMFNFSGDDDVWVYVDGVKVLDLGGDHKVSAGSINFTDGLVYYKSAVNTVGSVTSTTDSWAYSSDNVKTVDLVELLGAYGVTFKSTDASTKHTLQMFYMERGAYQSNCSLSFNLPQASGLSVRNNVTADNVNVALQDAALYSANPDYFTYQVSSKLVSSVPSDISSAYSEISFPTPSGTETDLDYSTPLYPYYYETFRNFSNTAGETDYKLSQYVENGTGSAGTKATFSTSDYVNVSDAVYGLSDDYISATTSGYANVTGKTDESGIFHLLGSEMATFDNKVPSNSLVIVQQTQALGEAGTDENGVLEYEEVTNNNVGNYYLTSYSIYDEKSKSYIVDKTDLKLDYTDPYSAQDSRADSDNADAFYFTNYSGSTEDTNSAMRVDFYNDITVGNIKIEKALDDGTTSDALFKYTVKFAQIFGDDSDTTFSEYLGLEYDVYDSATDTAVYKDKQIYGSNGIILQPGQYAIIEGVPVETRFEITERDTAGYSFVSFTKDALKSDGTQVTSTYEDTAYDYTDSSTTSQTTSSSAYSFIEDDFTYYKNMIPAVQDTQVNEGSRTDYISTSYVKYINKKENITITFKYYDRDTTNGQPAAISTAATAYSYSFDNLSAYTYYKGKTSSDVSAALEEKYGEDYTDLSVGDFICIDFEAILKEKAVEFATDTSITNLIDDYHMWTTQAAAVEAMQTMPNLQGDNTGKTNYTADEAVYHTLSNGKVGSASTGKWVNYLDEDGDDLLAEEFACGEQSSFDSVKNIVVWCYNVPKQYTVNIYGAQSASDLTVASSHNSNISGTAYISLGDSASDSAKTTVNAYYSQRLGDAKGDDYLDELAYLSEYNLSGYVDVCPEDFAEEEFTVGGTTYKFAYWSYNSDGSTVASTEYIYGNRVTGNFNLYAVYATETMAEDTYGLTISQDADDIYVDSSGVSRTRLNVLFTPYNLSDYDSNIKYVGLINIYVTKLIAESYTDAQIQALQKTYKDQLITYLNTMKAFSGSLTYPDTEITLTTKGYVFSTGTSSGSIALTNKNRVQFSSVFKTQSLYPSGTYSGKVGILQIGAMYYDDSWILSDNNILRKFTTD